MTATWGVWEVCGRGRIGETAAYAASGIDGKGCVFTAGRSAHGMTEME